jgi:hypothetical protein
MIFRLIMKRSAGVLLSGSARSDGAVIGDPDEEPDPIIVH